jgi:hypothetical protein
MAIEYIIQRGTLAGQYKTVARRQSVKSAWRAYFETVITTGEKKRLQEVKTAIPPALTMTRTLKSDMEYWS